MFKRKMFFMFLFVLFMAFIAGTFVVIGKNKLPETKAFDVGDYQYYIDKFHYKQLIVFPLISR